MIAMLESVSFKLASLFFFLRLSFSQLLTLVRPVFVAPRLEFAPISTATRLAKEHGGMIGANMEVGNPTGSNQFERKPANLPISKISQPQAARLLNVSDRSIRDAKTILREAPEKVPMIARIRLFPFGYVWV